MHCDWSFLAELLFGFVHLADEVYEALSRLWNTLFGPVDELELPHRPRLAVSRVGHLQNQQRLDQVAAFLLAASALVYLRTLNSLRMYWGMLYSAIGSTTKQSYRTDRSFGQYWKHFSC
jgi:hypothetical protein